MMFPNGIKEAAHHPRCRQAGRRHIFQQIKAAQNAVPFRDVAAQGVAPAFLAAQQGVVGNETGPDVFEPDRQLGHRNAVVRRQLVEHHRGGNALDNGAPFAALQKVMRQQSKDFQRADEPAGFVHQPDAVGVPIQCQTYGGSAGRCPGGRHPAAKFRQVGGDGFRLRHSGESRVGLGAQLGHGSMPTRQQAGNIAGAGPVHRIHQHGQASIADGVQVNQPCYRFPVGRAGVNVLPQAGGARGVRRDGTRRAGGCNAQL